MKIRAPSLKLDMAMQGIVVKDWQPVIVCRVGVYEATTELSREDVVAILKCLVRPRILLAFARLVLARPAERK